ncbi:MAG: RNA methyltransferase [Alphaproteobacteria bacterium]|nr:RNA methyltransferase [Alphaproteobacteria bacterium]
MTHPAIILVNPQMGENIGAVARAMMNFGLRDLRIVAPRDGWPNPAADAMAAHGLPIIESAKLYATTREAVADLHYVYASTARDRRIHKPQLSPREASQDGVSRARAGQNIGILYGPERSGLENEDIALAHAILTIPTDEKYSSLNIAQSAVVIAYEWWVAGLTGDGSSDSQEANHGAKKDSLPATGEQVDLFFGHLEAALDRTNFFKLDEKKPHMWRNLRSTFLRAELSEQEVHTLRGMLSALEKGDKRPK